MRLDHFFLLAINCLDNSLIIFPCNSYIYFVFVTLISRVNSPQKLKIIQRHFLFLSLKALSTSNVGVKKRLQQVILTFFFLFCWFIFVVNEPRHEAYKFCASLTTNFGGFFFSLTSTLFLFDSGVKKNGAFFKLFYRERRGIFDFLQENWKCMKICRCQERALNSYSRVVH